MIRSGMNLYRLGSFSFSPPYACAYLFFFFFVSGGGGWASCSSRQPAKKSYVSATSEAEVVRIFNEERWAKRVKVSQTNCDLGGIMLAL